jgi:hypothetical protein
MIKTVYYRMRASKNNKGDWIADQLGAWQYLPVNEGKGKRPEWLKIAEKQGARAQMFEPFLGGMSAQDVSFSKDRTCEESESQGTGAVGSA